MFKDLSEEIGFANIRRRNLLKKEDYHHYDFLVHFRKHEQYFLVEIRHFGKRFVEALARN